MSDAAIVLNNAAATLKELPGLVRCDGDGQFLRFAWSGRGFPCVK